MSDFNLQAHGINVTDIVRNAPASSFSEEAIRGGQVATISNRGALIAYSGRKTGRSPATNGSSNTRNRSHTGLRRRHFKALLFLSSQYTVRYEDLIGSPAATASSPAAYVESAVMNDDGSLQPRRWTVSSGRNTRIDVAQKADEMTLVQRHGYWRSFLGSRLFRTRDAQEQRSVWRVPMSGKGMEVPVVA